MDFRRQFIPVLGRNQFLLEKRLVAFQAPAPEIDVRLRQLDGGRLNAGLQPGHNLSLAHPVATIDQDLVEHAIDRADDIDHHEGFDQALMFPSRLLRLAGTELHA